jgi:hypothetical protein
MTRHKLMTLALSFLGWSSMIGIVVLMDFTEVTAQKLTIVALMFVMYFSGYIEGLCKGYLVP